MELGGDAVGASQPMDLPPAHTVQHGWQGITIPGDAGAARVWSEGKLGGAWVSYRTRNANPDFCKVEGLSGPAIEAD